jgi:hypothetical protein
MRKRFGVVAFGWFAQGRSFCGMEMSASGSRLCPEKPALIWHPEADVPFLPWGLANLDVPTACFQVDTYAYTRQRILWSTLFDLVLVFHPGYEVAFREAGHPGARLMPHAAEAQLFSAPEQESIYEVGWGARTHI